MSDDFKLENTPTLTFEPFKDDQSQTGAGAAAAAAAVQTPPSASAAAADVQEVELTEEEQKMVDEFAKQIDITNSTQVLQYGAGAQQKVASFSEAALGNVRSKDLGEVGDMISSVVAELKSFDVAEEEKGLFGMFKKNVNKLTSMKAKYAKVETNINAISEQLEGHQVTLLKDVATLDQLYELNMSYYKELQAHYQHMHDIFTQGLDRIGFNYSDPEGSYFIMVDISDFSHGMNDVEFCEKMAREIGVAAVPGSSFFKEDVNHLARFHFAKKDETLIEALNRLADLKTKMA